MAEENYKQLSERYTLLVDMDDTLEELGKAWNKWLTKTYSLDIPYSAHTTWDMDKIYPMLTKEQIFEPLYIPEFWDTVEPMKDAMKYLTQLWKKGFPIYIATATHPESVSMKFRWLKKFYPFIDYKHLIIIKKKQLLSGWYLIDDAPHNFGGNYKGIIITKPWNTDFDAESANVTRVNNWKQIYNKLITEYEETEKMRLEMTTI